MSESLRDLVVTLSLNSGDFKKNIDAVSAQIREAKSEFALAAAGIDKFDQSLDGMRSSSASLSQQLTLQNRIVDQYRRMLESARTRLAGSVEAHDKVKASLATARVEYEKTCKTLQEFRKVYKQVADTMGEESAQQLLGDAMEEYEQQVKDAGQAVKDLEGRLKVAERTMRNNANAVTKAKTGYMNAQAAAKKMSAEIDELNRKIKEQETGWYRISKSLEDFSKKAGDFSKNAGKFGRSLTTALTAPIVGAAVAVNKAAIDYESAFTSVQKTVDATEGEFAELSAQIKQMSTEVAMDAADIAEIFAIAGQMGIETENLAEFARVVIDLGNSTDIVAEEAAASLSQFRNITNMSSEDFDRLGSTIVDLGNNFATTEASIMEMALRIAGAGHQVGLSEPEILAMAAALSSVGIEAEMGGSALSKALVKMEVAVETGGEALEDFASVAGMTGESFVELWDADPATAFMSFLTGLSKMDEEGISAIATLNEIGISEVRLRDTLLRSTNAVDLIARALGLANSAWAENVALGNESNRRYSTTASRAKNMANRFKNFGITLGEDMNPALNDAIDSLSEFADWLNNLDASSRTTLLNVAALAASIGPLSLGLSGVSRVVSSATGLFAKFAAAVAKNGTGLSALMKTVTASPIGWIAMAAAIGIAVKAITDYATGAAAAREGITAMTDAADRWKRTQAETIYDNEGLGAFDVDSEAFTGAGKELIQSAETWKANLIEIWNDGKRETNDTVKEWSASFVALNDGIREELQQMKDNADRYGYADVSDDLQSDIDSLNAMDKEIDNLLKKRKNRNLSEKDQLRLDELLQQREAIVIKYRLEPEGPQGYQQILDQLEADEARANASGQSVSPDRYAEAVKATAEGYAAAKKSIDAWYNSEYATIQLIQDEEERRAAQASLDQRYNDERIKGAQEYAQTLAQVVGPVIDSEGLQSAAGDLDVVMGLLGQLSASIGGDKSVDRNNVIGQLGTFAESLNEGELASYASLLTQIQTLYSSLGLGKDEVTSLFGFDPDTDLAKFDLIKNTLTALESEDLQGLQDMFTQYLPEEVQTIMVDLELTQAKATWSAFALDPGATITGEVGKLTITDAALTAFNNYTKKNPVDVEGVIKISGYDGTIESLLGKENTRLFNENGVEIPITPGVIEKLKNSDFLTTPNAQGGVDIIVVPRVVGTTLSVRELGMDMEEDDPFSLFGVELGGELSSTADHINEVTEALRNYNKESSLLSRIPLVGGFAKSAEQKAMASYVEGVLSSEDIAAIQTFVQEAFAAIQNGEELLPEDMGLLQNILGMVSEMETAGVGQDIVAGIKSGMSEETDWETVSATVGEDIITALKAALGIESPSTVAASNVGIFIPQGIQQGMLAYSLAPAAMLLAASAISRLRSAFSMGSFIGIGMNVSLGIAAGILAGIPAIAAAASSAADAASEAAKGTAEIHSPSRLTKREIGIPWTQGIVVGIQEEARRQSKAIANAMHYMSDASAGYMDGRSAYGNQRTYNSTSNASVNVQNMYINDKQDVYSLALEIASLVKRQNSGRGM